MKKITILLLLFTATILQANAYTQKESVLIGTVCPTVNTCTNYKFIIADNQSYYDHYYNSGKDISLLTSREKQYYISSLVNTHYIKNNFTPLYK